MSTYCEFFERPTGDNSCRISKDPSKDSQNCEINDKTKRCRIKPSLKKTLRINASNKKTNKPTAPAPTAAAAPAPAPAPWMPSPKTSSKLSDSARTNLKKYEGQIKDWESFKKAMKVSYSEIITRHEPYGANNNALDLTTVNENIKLNDVPLNAESILTMEKYIDDYEENKNKKFYKMKTCEKTCSNKGFFLKEEIDMLLSSDNLKCPFCKGSFHLKKAKMIQPFGEMKIKVNHDWITIEFTLNPSRHDKKAKKDFRLAYYPFCEEGILACWLLKQGWNNGNLFKVGISVSTGKYGITYSGIHMRTSKSGSYENHGYGSNKLKDLREKVIPNLISECNAVDIFSPEQIKSFVGLYDIKDLIKENKAKSVIGKTFLKYQTSISELRNKHIVKLRELDIKEHRLIYAYPQGFLMNIIFAPKSTYDRLSRQLKLYKKSVVPLNVMSHQNIQEKIKKLDTSYTNSFFPEYICNLTRIIRSFPKPKKPFYVYRSVLRKTPDNFDWIAQPIPFSTSMNQWMAISFSELDNIDSCCLFRIKITTDMNCIILGNTPFQSSQHINDEFYNEYNRNIWDFDTVKTADLSKYNQFEVLLPPGVLKVDKIRHNMYKPGNKSLKKYKNNHNFDTKDYYEFPTNGITLIDTTYEALYPTTITPEDLVVEMR